MNDTILGQAPLRHPDRLFIGGEWVEPSSGAMIQVVNPSTEEVFLTVAEAQEADVHRAVSAARAAFDQGPWPSLSHGERASYLRQISQRLTDRWTELADLWTREMGIVRNLSGAVAPLVTGLYDYYASLAETFPFEEHNPLPYGGFGMLVHEPVGVVAAIVPWNAPPILTAQKVAPALLAGCTIVLKASPEAPASAYLLAEIADEIGLPPGVLNVVTAEREVSELLVRHPGVDKVSFTGSVAAGRKIAAICGDRIARYTLELGGKSAAVILDDYELGAAAESLAGAIQSMTGQVCAALTRVVVPRQRQDELLEALGAAFSSIVVGDPFAPTTGMGPLATARQRHRVEGYIAKGKAEGAVLVTGGGRPRHLDRGYFVEPTVFGKVGNDMTIAREEIFGPVVSVIPARDEAHAIAIANDTVFGLNASVFTHDADRAYAAARQLRSGTVGHNGLKGELTLGFGGFKQSGVGREGGVEGLRAYLESKTIILDTAPGHVADAQ
jgi:aldehyde dehydrogenase (NAD+)